MSMLDRFVLEISRVIETLGDKIDYQLAKDASRKAAKQKKKRSMMSLTGLSRDGFEFQLDHARVNNPQRLSI
jgi:hypothetical protein